MKKILGYVFYSLLIFILGLKFTEISSVCLKVVNYVKNVIFTTWISIPVFPKSLLVALIMLIIIRILIKIFRKKQNGLINKIKIHCKEIDENLFKIVKVSLDIIFIIIISIIYMILTLI